MAAVRLGTLSRYGHCVIAETVPDDGPIGIIEPMPSGCRRRQAHPREFVWSDVPLNDAQREIIVAYAVSTIGYGYNWPAIFRFVLRWWAARIAELIPGHRRRRAARFAFAPEPARSVIMCSEQSVRAYRLPGVRIDMGSGKPADSVSPGDLRQWLDDRRRAVNRRA
jgi:hypothetical protein